MPLSLHFLRGLQTGELYSSIGLTYVQKAFMRMFWSLVEKDERISLDTFDAFLIILSMCLSNWKYFSYDRASDKSRCLIDDMKDSSGIQKCDALLNGNNATNLKNHLKYKHKSVCAELEKLECQSKDSRKATNLTGDLPKRQTQLIITS